MIARKSLLIVINNIVGAVLGFISLYFVARYMGETVLGIIGFTLAYIGMFSLVTSLGYDSAHIKRISEEKDLGTCIGTYISIKLFLIMGMILLALIGILLWRLFSPDDNKSEKEFVLFIVLIYYIVLSLVQMFGQTFNARREIAKSQVVNIAEHVVRAPIMIAVAILIPLGVAWLAGAYLFGVLASLAVSLILIRRYPLRTPSKEMFRSYTKFALPILIPSMIVPISLYIDKVMIEFFWGSDYVGYYFGSQRIIDILKNLSISLGIVLFPTISYYAAKSRYREITKVMAKAERYLSMIIFPITIYIILLRNEIVEAILGPSFVEIGAPVLAALAVFILLTTLARPYHVLIAGLNRPKISAKIVIASAVLNIVLNFLFIPKRFLGVSLFGWGALGAAIATIISTLLLLLLYYGASNRLIGIKPSSRIIRHFFAAMISGIPLYLINNILISNDIWATIRASGPLELLYSGILLLLLGIMILAIYIAILVGIREFKKEDLRFFLDMLHPGRMGEYIKSELKEKNDIS